MNESDVWERVKRSAKKADPTSDLTRHEDRLSIGTTDTSFCIMSVAGWVELKAYLRWPVRPGSIVRFDNLMPLQRVWITRRGAAGAPVTLLAAFGDELYLFPWWAVPELGFYDERRTRMLAVWSSEWYGGTDLAIALIRRWPTPKSRFWDVSDGLGNTRK